MTRVRHTTSRRRRKHEDHINHEAWAIPYADLLTLLLAFFVVMYAISSVNAGKYRVLSDSLFTAFRGAPRGALPIPLGGKQESNLVPPAPAPHPIVASGKPQIELEAAPQKTALIHSGSDGVLTPPLPAQAAASAAALSHVADEIEHALNPLVKKDLMTIRRSDFWIEVEMRADLLFPSGSAKLSSDAIDIISRLGAVLSPFPNTIRVEGHTDNVPIRTPVFFSNWELSAARAGSVVRVLATRGVAPGRLAVIGYGEQRPLKTNGTPDGRNANRRVVVVILSTQLMRQNASSESGSLSSSDNSPQTTAAASPEPLTGAASLPTAQNSDRHDTGTEPAP